MKFLALLTLFTLTSTIMAKPPGWIDTVTTPPSSANIPTANLSPLLTTGTARAAWPYRRAALRNTWLKILGPLPQPPPGAITTELIADESLATCTRKLIRYEAEPGRFARAYLLRPAGDETTTRPGIVVFHPTNKESIKVVAGTGGRPDQHLALNLVERGFVCICPENYINEEASWNAAVAKAKKRHPDSTGMATMLADGMRAVDVLLNQPGVDPNRIGTIGHSLGAKEVLYLMAFDERVKAGVFSEGGIGLSFSNWDDPWYLGKQIRAANFKHDHHELLALIVPRPLLIFGGETGRAADGDHTWPYVIAANELSRNLGYPPPIGFINHHEGHFFSPAMAEKGFEWLRGRLEE